VILKGENRSSSGKPCCSEYTDLTETGLEFEPGLRGESPTTVRLRHCFIEGSQASFVCPSDRATCVSSSSSSSSYIFHEVGPLIDPFASHVSRSLFKGLP
jgi:hypothetical protein